MSDDQNASWAELLRGKNGLRSFALVGSVALEATNVFLVTTIMPSVVKDVGGFSYYAMNTTMYVIASIIGAAVAGRLSERIGSKRIYLGALALFSVALLISALAPNMFTLIAGRTIEGFAGGILISMAYVLIRELFEERLWPRAIGLISAMWGIATFAGPAIGGVFTEYGHWRWAFWGMQPVVVVIAIVVIVWLPSLHNAKAPSNPQRTVMPTSRLVLLTASVLVISGASVIKNGYIAALGVLFAFALLGGLIYLDKRADIRLLPKGSWGATPQRAIYITMSCLALATAVDVFNPFFLQKIQGYSSLIAGYLTTAMAAGWSFSSLFGSSLPKRWGRRCIQFGPVLMAAALLSFSWMIQQETGFTHGWGLAAFILNLIAIGMGIGLAWPHLLSTLLITIPDAEGSIASSSISTVQQYAMAVGSALAGLIVNILAGEHHTDISSVSRAAFWLFFIFGLIVTMGIFSSHRALQRTATSS